MRLFKILTCLFLLACSTRQGTANPQSDSVITVSVDTTISEEEPDYRQEYISQYQQKVQLDTTYTEKGKTYRLLLVHYCTMDSALTVPAKYNWDTAEDFVTHNFQSDISLSVDSGVPFRKTITKKDFNSILSPELKSYGALLYPALDVKNDSIVVNYSISIPVTDVGVGAAIQFDKKGNFTVTER